MSSGQESVFSMRFARYLRGPGIVVFAAITWYPAVVLFKEHVAELSQINGESMYPYLNTDFNTSLVNDQCWVNKFRPLDDLRRGMVVTFRSPSNPHITSIKRVIALEGDQVQTRAPYPYPVVDVPSGHVWVEGDNHDSNKTFDSMHYGPISMNLITGRVTHVITPWSSFGEIRWWEFKGRTRVFRGRGKN